MGITCFIIVKGVESGIERFNKIGMPALFVILIILLIRALTMPGAGEGLQYMLIPDWSKVTFSTVLSALGAGVLLTQPWYGYYGYLRLLC